MPVKKIYKNQPVSNDIEPKSMPSTQDKKVDTLETRVRQLTELVNKQQMEISRLMKTQRKQSNDITSLLRTQPRT